MKLEPDIHNYYEHLVVEAIENQQLEHAYDSEFLADLSCLVLSKLPPRYVRHDVDMAYFLTPAERQQMRQDVDGAIDDGLKHLLSQAPRD